MIVVPGLSPALIIGHHEDHVGAIGKRHDRAQQQYTQQTHERTLKGESKGERMNRSAMYVPSKFLP